MSGNSIWNWFLSQEQRKNPAVFLVEWILMSLLAGFFWAVVLSKLQGSHPSLATVGAISAFYGFAFVYLRLLKERGLLPQRLETARQGLYLCPTSAGLLGELAAALAEGQDYAGLAALLEDTQYAEIALPRRSELVRPDVYLPHLRQVIVANAEQLLIVAAWRDPAIWLELIDRYIITAERFGELLRSFGE